MENGTMVKKLFFVLFLLFVGFSSAETAIRLNPSSLEKTIFFYPFYNHLQFTPNYVSADYSPESCESDANQIVCLVASDKNLLNVSIRLEDKPLFFETIETTLKIDGNDFLVDYSIINVGFFVAFEPKEIREGDIVSVLFANDYLFKNDKGIVSGVRVWWIASIIVLLFVFIAFGIAFKSEFLKSLCKAIILLGILLFALFTFTLVSLGMTSTAIVNLLIAMWVLIIILAFLVWVV